MGVIMAVRVILAGAVIMVVPWGGRGVVMAVHARITVLVAVGLLTS